MKNRITAGWLSAICIALTGLVFVVAAQAQQVAPAAGGSGGSEGGLFRPAPAARPAGLPGLSGPGGGVASPEGGLSAFGIGSGGGGGGARPKSNYEKLQDAIGQLKKAEGEDARKKSLETISTLVNAIFDEDMKRRQSEVDDIRDRVKRLKALIDRRKASKDRIVDLQYKVQINEVEGLGFAVRRKTRSRSAASEMRSMGMMMGAGMSSGGNPYGYSRGDQMAGGYGAAAPSTPDPRVKAEKALNAAVAKLKGAQKGDDRNAAAKALKPALEAYFAADLKVREQEITGIQKRVENLDALIERRRKARDEIISLQLEVLSNEADGLGFFSTSARKQSGTYGWMYGGQPASGGFSSGGATRR